MLELYKNIRLRREALGMSQEELAQLTGYTSRSSIAKIEKGDVDLPLSKIKLFAEALNISPSELMGDTWENNVLDNARLDIVRHFDGDAFKIAEFQEAERLDGERDSSLNHTIAAHFDGDEYTEEELDKIKEFAAFVKSTRK